MRIPSLFVLAALPLSLMADEAPAVAVKQLTLDAASQVAQATIKACRVKGVQVGVTVVDRNGLVQVSLRDTLAPPITLEISAGKARAAAYFSVSTEALGDRANTPIGRVPGVVMARGGLPIQAGGAFYGAVGVSGAPSGQTDEECAQEGMAALLEDLELGG